MVSKVSTIGRREFIRVVSIAGAGAWVGGGVAPAIARTRNPARLVRVAIMGLQGRGGVLNRSFASMPDAEVGYVIDVDERAVASGASAAGEIQGAAPTGVDDFRRALDDPTIDALVIAAPDHWHTPATVLALSAGKHVYVEKPASHNPRESELIVAAQQRYGRLVQMGNQQRSDPRTIEVIREIHGGLIGRAYYARAWYANTRDGIGRGRNVAVPDWLNYELWQGPAPRRAFQDNVIHYNWHWFEHWGTGEICNNGAHEIDVCRWALEVDAPVRVTSAGGRYHFDDDWEFPDTQDAGFDFEGGKTIVWQGRSCNGYPIEGRGRGSSIHGTGGTVVLDRSGYTVYDLRNRVVREGSGEQVDALDTRGGDGMTDRHIANFLGAVRGEASLNSPIGDGQKSTLLCHLGNIAQKTGRALRIDPATGRIRDDEDAARLWARDYAPGWEPTV